MPKCPNCFIDLPSDRFAWVAYGSNMRTDPIASAFAGVPVQNAGVRTAQRPPGAPQWMPAPPPPENAGDMVYEACPICHYRLPADWYAARVVAIAMSGARYSGKSIHIGVMANQLKPLLSKLGTFPQPANRETHHNLETEYWKPLYEELGVVQATPRAETGSHQKDPLILDLGRLNGDRHVTYLVVRDVAGEEMEDPGPNPQHLRFLEHAHTVFFMFDPLAVAAVRQTLHGVIPTINALGGDPTRALSNLIHLMGPQSRTRIAVIVSKFDAIQSLRQVQDPDWRRIMANPGSAFLSETDPFAPVYFEDDGALLHEEIRSLLFRLGAGNIVHQVENPRSGSPIPHRFFAVSALGASPAGSHLSEQGITPSRVLDPLRWTFATQQIISAV